MTEVFDCKDLRDALMKGASLDDPRLRAHVRECEGCAELMAEDASLGHALAAVPAMPEMDLSGMLAGLDDALGREESKLAWLRNRSTTARIAAVVGVGVLLVLVGGAAKIRPDISAYPLPRLILTVVVYLSLVGLAAVIAFRPLYQKPVPRAVLYALIGVAALLPFVVASMPQAHAHIAGTPLGNGADFIPRAFACFRYGVALSLPVLVLAALADRGAFRIGVWPVLLGAAAGLIGTVALELHCPITEPIHLLLGHASIAMFVGILALAVRVVRKQKV